jgi:hypothetical protein
LPASLHRNSTPQRAYRLLASPERASHPVQRLARCFALDARLCLQLIGWRLALPVLKFVVPLPKLARLMWIKPSALSVSAEAQQAAERRVLEIVRSGGRLLVSRNCLERSLVLYRYLSSRGADPRLVVGVTRQADGVGGHTWIENDGNPVEDLQSASFERVAVFGPDGRLCST